MIYSKVDLMQIERRDIPTLKDFINEFQIHLPEYKQVNTSALNEQYIENLSKHSKYEFAIRAYEDRALLKTLGFCSVSDIDWISRHGELFFVMQDKGPGVTIPSTEASKVAFGKLLRFAFEELNLEKVWIEVFEMNNIKETLEKFGFVAEGVRREARFKRGRFINSTICSLLIKEYKEHL